MKNVIIAAAFLAGVLVCTSANVYAADPDARAALGTPLSKNSQKEIEKTLTDVIEEVVDKDVEDVIDDMCEADRERLGKKSEKTPNSLKATVDQFKAAWKSKYGHDFDIRGAQIPYEVTQTDAKGELAQVSLPTDNVVSGLKLNLVNEGKVTNAWRIDLPDTTSNEALKSNLQRAVRDITDGAAGWPANEKDAYRSVALRILGAISGSVA